ncbi:hypothetical protein GOBAR_DD32711 [Gossypium barbadense]|nr:hypothetical protein GOBAR_DD32711 [Gossypium barbadense]
MIDDETLPPTSKAWYGKKSYACDKNMSYSSPLSQVRSSKKIASSILYLPGSSMVSLPPWHPSKASFNSVVVWVRLPELLIE